MASAYFIPFATVLDKLEQKTGGGFYEIVQEISLQEGELGVLTGTETWVIDSSADIQRVTAHYTLPNTESLQIDYFYEGSKRFFKQAGKLYTQKSSQLYLMPLFFDKKIENILEVFKKLRIFSSGERVNSKDLGSTVRLGRNAGTPHLVYGEERKLWIEQDQNLVRKIDLSKTQSIRFDDYSEFRRNLHFPKKIIYNWSEGEAEVSVSRVSGLSNNQGKKLLKVNNLTENELEKSNMASSEALTALKKFYSQYR